MKTKSIEKLFLHILIYTYLLLPVTLLFSRRKTSERILIGIYGAVIFLMLGGYFYGFIKTSFLFFTVYTFLEYLFFTSILWLNLKSKRFRIIILALSTLFVAFQTYTYINYNVPTLDSIPVGIETILIFLFITFYLYESFQSDTSHFIYEHPCFWLCIGMMIYLGGTFFFNILLAYLDKEHVDQYWYLTYVADIVKNLLFSVSIVIHINRSTTEKLRHQKHLPYLDLDMMN